MWSVLRQEVLGTVDEFRQKGAVGALRDAALDTRDLAADAGTWLWTGVQGLVGEEQEEAVLRSASIPIRGATALVEFSDGSVVNALVVDVDGVSEPPRARVTIPGAQAPILVPILAPGVAFHQPELHSNTLGTTSILKGLKQEWESTVQEFREKGAVGAMKDAALDAVDIVGSTAATAVDGARSLATPLIDLDWGSKPAPHPQAAVGDQTADTGPAIAGTAGAPSDTASSTGPRASAMALLNGIREEISGTVQDFREKGAVGAMRDAALDAVDIVGSTASTAVSGARSLATPLLEQIGPLPDLWAATEPPPPASEHAEEGAAARPSLGVTTPVSPTTAAAPSQSRPEVHSADPEVATPKAAAPAAHDGVPTQGEPQSRSGSSAAAENPELRSAMVAGNPERVPAVILLSPRAKEPAAPIPDSEMPAGKPARKSIVSMRRNMFEKPKKDDEPFAKQDTEELID